MEKARRAEEVRSAAQAAVEQRLLDELLPEGPPRPGEDAQTAAERRHRTREKLAAQLRAGALDDRTIEIEVQTKALPIAALGPLGFEQLGPDFQNVFEKLIPSKAATRRTTVAEARRVFLAEEIDKLVDESKVSEAALRLVEQSGIIFLDEIDKVAGPASTHGPDVSRQGVQRDLLPIVEGSTVATRHGLLRTDHILFIAAGAFHSSKPADLMPELQGRFPIRVELGSLTRDDFIRILTEPANSLVRQAVALLATEGLAVTFTPDGIDEIASVADRVNADAQNIGARRLHTIMEKVVEQISFDGPDLAEKRVTIDAAYVRQRVADIAANADLSKFIL
jgi:ATP-dependent HslUV protease ATP-binding subunit HslU